MAGVPEFSIFIKFNSSGPAWLVDVAGKWVLLVLSPVEQAGLLRLGGRAWRSRDSTLGLWPGALAPGATGWHPRGGAASWSPDQAQWTCMRFSVRAHAMRLDWRPEPGAPGGSVEPFKPWALWRGHWRAHVQLSSWLQTGRPVRTRSGFSGAGTTWALGGKGVTQGSQGTAAPAPLGTPVGQKWGLSPADGVLALQCKVRLFSVYRVPSLGAGTAGWGHCGWELRVTAGTTRWGHLAQTRGVREGFLEEMTEEPSPE